MNRIVASTLLLFGLCTTPLAAQSAPDVSPAVQEARNLVQAGRETDATAILRARVQVEPTDAAAWGLLAGVLNQIEQYTEAKVAADHAVSLAPDNPAARYNRGLVLWELGDFAGSVAEMDMALNLRPGLVPALVERGSARAVMGDLTGARTDWAAAERLDPAFVWVHYYRALADISEGRHAQAAAALDRVTAEQPGHAGAHLWRWIAYVGAGRTPPAWPRGEAWPGPVAAYLFGEMDEAALLEASDRQALPIDRRRRATALFFIGQKKLSQGDRPGARTAFSQALSLNTPRFMDMVVAADMLRRLPG